MAEWRENDAQWYEERMLHCATCGRMIARRYLWVPDAAGAKMFCSDGCHELYNDYWLAERGEGYRSPPDIGDTYADLMVK